MFRKGSFSHLLKDHRLELTLLKSEQALNEARRGIVFHGSCLHTEQALQEAQVDDAALEISEWQFISNGHQNSILKIC